jgi:Leucine-rich repeat (LRR) protein
MKNKEIKGLIIKEPSSSLFNFTEITLRNFYIESIKRDALFLFEKIRRIRFLHSKEVSTEQIAHMVDLFQEMKPVGEKIEVEIQCLHLNGDLHNLANYRISRFYLKKQTFTSELLDQMNDSLNTVTSLKLESCAGSNFDARLFEFCKRKLTKLDLENYTGETSRRDLLHQLSNLNELKLSLYYSQDSFDIDYVSSLVNLTRLDLSGTKLHSLLKRNSFESLANLETLDLRSTSLQSIEPGAFNGLSQLARLDLRNSFIEKLSMDVFQGLDNLRELVICNSYRLNEIEPEAFRGLGKLRNLNLSHSQKLSMIRANVFAHLKQLTSLNMYECGIQFIDPGAFDDLVSLDELDLHENKLETFEVSCSPRIVNLSGNHQLRSVKFTRADISHIEEINLDKIETKLDDFNSVFVQSTQSNLKIMTITFEALGNERLLSSFKKLSRIKLTQTTNSPIEIHNEALQGLENLRELEVSINSLEVLVQKLKNLPRLEVLKLNSRGQFLKFCNYSAFFIIYSQTWLFFDRFYQISK